VPGNKKGIYMTYLVDSHCHLDRLELEAFGGSMPALLDMAKGMDVRTVLCIGVDLENSQKVIELAQQFDQVYASVGLHPSEDKGEEATVEHLTELAGAPKVIAIGETGLDYYYEHTERELQRERFIIHIKAAEMLKKPLIIHTRKAEEDTLALLREHNVSAGIFHCFTEDYAMAKAGLDLGLYISFSGIITFKNAEALREVVKKVPLERILVETDAPYLTPVPHRGKPNFPGYTRLVAECVAGLKGISYTEVAEVTTNNFMKLFNLKRSTMS
jgi:TatD DNase family protein